MARLSPETIWNTNEKELLNILDGHALVPKPDKVYFYAPSFMYYRTKHYKSQPNHFPTISITGAGCALNCKHCAGKILETMQPACTPEKLFELCAELKLKGALGCLVSGGCQPDGSVPLKDFVPALERIKRELDLTVLVHTGIVDFATAKALKNAHVDTALIDIIGSEETIKEVYNLNVTVKDYANSLDALHESGLPFVPHIIVGLHNGTLKGEFQALTLIKPHKPSALVVIAFMPIRGTPMSLIKPPKPTDIAKILTMARLMFPETPLVLGCMRPKGKHRTETDVLALKAGVNAIAFPSEEAVKYAETQNHKLAFSPYCCSQIHLDMDTRKPPASATSFRSPLEVKSA
jgi:uncharacterized radical SAM superfamily protein